MGQKSLLQKVLILFFSLFGHVFYGEKGVGFFFFFVSKIASDMTEWMDEWIVSKVGRSGR